MNVLHVYRVYFPDAPGGIQEAIRQIALACEPLGVESRIFALSARPEPAHLDRPEGRVVRSRSWAAPASCDLGLVDSLRKFREQAEWADIIHYHFPWPFADALHFMARPNRPVVMTYHSDVVNKGWLATLYRPLMRWMLGRMDRIVATSPSYLESSPVLRSLQGDSRVAVVPLGLTEDSYAEARRWGERTDIEGDFGVRQGRYFLFLGALRSYKGLEVLLDAVESAEIDLVIAGDGAAGFELRRAMRDNPRVRWVGMVSDAEKMALIAGCRALVLPSHMRSEAFGMVLVEAAMSGKPLISCEIGTGTSFVNADGETGLVVPPRDAGALRVAMMRLLDDDALAVRLGRGARQRYERLFSGDALGQAYADLYAQLGRSGS